MSTRPTVRTNPHMEETHDASTYQYASPPTPTPTPAPAEADPRVQIIEGSECQVSKETLCLLRSRLRAAALSLFIGFVAFLGLAVAAWGLGVHPVQTEPTALMPLIVTSLQLFAALVLAAAWKGLCGKCKYSARYLRVYEAVIFGVPGLFFLAMGYEEGAKAIRDLKYLPVLVTPWLILIFVYSTFIPNTWKRAAVATGLMAVVPVALTAWLAMRAGDMFLPPWTTVASTILVMALATFVATLGAHTIGSLRVEAIKARELGQYRLKRLLGSGGMGEVYLAEHLLMKRPCAIKMIKPEKAGDPRVLARFEREVRATAKLSHWNNIDIFDYGRASDGTFYYVMEFLPGMNLGDLVRRHGPLSPERVIHLMRQTCDALAEAHGAGLIHRDIKPANIFAAERGGMKDIAKLLDFGLVKPIAALEQGSLTQEGSLTGSPLYMSPEQATGDGDPDARSDIYSLGCVMYFLLSGKPVFEDERPMKVLIAHVNQEPTPLSRHEPSTPRDLEDVVLRCLAKNPADRFQNAWELAKALDDCSLSGEWDSQKAHDWWIAAKRQDVQVEPLAVPA
jgi:eukaryotic-like serine/threonine-protein kinase